MKYLQFFKSRIIYDKLKYKVIWSRGCSHDQSMVTFYRSNLKKIDIHTSSNSHNFIFMSSSLIRWNWI